MMRYKLEWEYDKGGRWFIHTDRPTLIYGFPETYAEMLERLVRPFVFWSYLIDATIPRS